MKVIQMKALTFSKKVLTFPKEKNFRYNIYILIITNKLEKVNAF